MRRTFTRPGRHDCTRVVMRLVGFRCANVDQVLVPVSQGSVRVHTFNGAERQ